MPNFAEITALLVDLTGKDFATRPRFQNAWGNAENTACADIKRLLVSAPVLKFPHYEREFGVHVDANDLGVGAFLAQP